MMFTRIEIDNRLVEAANAHTAINRLRSDIKVEYKNPGGLAYVLKFLDMLERFNNNETYFLQELATSKEEEDGRGNLSLAEMELRREAAIKAWDARIARKKARMQSSRLIQFKQEA
jgi:hypothetical protein